MCVCVCETPYLATRHILSFPIQWMTICCQSPKLHKRTIKAVGAPAGFLPRVSTVFFFFFFLGGGGNFTIIPYIMVKWLYFVSLFYKVNLEKRLEHFLFLKCTFFLFFSFFKVTTKRPVADNELKIAYVWSIINLAFSNHHDLPKIKSIDINQFKHITMLV